VRPEYGRFTVKDPTMMTFTPMWGNARSALCSGGELDVDAVQCQPNLLLSIMQRMTAADPDDTPPFDALTYMCAHRESAFEDSLVSPVALARYNANQKSMDTQKDVLKSLCTLVMFGGGMSTWKSKYGLQTDEFKLGSKVAAFVEQVPKLAKHVVAQDEFCSLVAWHIDKRKRHSVPAKRKATPGSKLAVILQHTETELVLRCMQHFKEVGLHVTVYCYDGFQIKKPESDEQQATLDAALEQINTFEPNSTFIVKPWKDPVPGLDQVQLPPPPAIEKLKPDKFKDMLQSVIGAWEDGLKNETPRKELLSHVRKLAKAVFEEQKRYFEETHFFVRDASGIGELKIPPSNAGCLTIHVDQSKMNRVFANLTTLVFTGDDDDDDATKKPPFKRVPFLPKWQADVDRREFDNVQMFPPGGKPCPVDTFNLWRGFPIASVPLDMDADITPILDHWVKLIPDEACREYALDWQASKVQLPGRKLEVCLILYGECGVGKSCIVEEPMTAFFGTHCKITSNLADLNGKFADNTMNVVTIMNEATGRDTKCAADSLKDLITATSQSRELKGVQQQFGINCSRDLIFTTNHHDCVKLEGDADRRYCIIACSVSILPGLANTSPEAQDYFCKLRRCMCDPKCMRRYFEHLCKRDLLNFNPRTYPSSALRESMIQGQERPELTFIKHYLTNRTEAELKHIAHTDLFSKYSHFYQENQFRADSILNSNKFKQAMANLPGVSQVRLSSGPGARGVRIDREALQAHLGVGCAFKDVVSPDCGGGSGGGGSGGGGSGGGSGGSGGAGTRVGVPGFVFPEKK
jgi:hypothetical protein